MKSRLLIGLVLLSAFSETTFAGGFQVNTQGQKAIGMGGAFTGLCSDASAVYFNPAGIPSLIRSHQVITGTSLIFPAISVSTDAVSNTDMRKSVATPVQIYYAGKLNEHVGFGFGLNNQFGASGTFDDDWQGKYIIQKISLKTFMYQPTVSFKINRFASFGIGYVFSTGEFEFKKAIPAGNNNSDYGEASLSGKGKGRGFNLGFFTHPFEEVTAGISYRSEQKISISDGVATFTKIPVSLQTIFPEKTTFRSSLTLPSVLSAGFAFRPDSLKKLLIVFDVVKTYWSAYDTLQFNFENVETPDSKIEKLWINTMTYRIGASYKLSEKFELRAGIYQDDSPIPDGHLSPELPDNTHTGYTLGIGLKISKTISADISWLYSNIRREGSLSAEGFSGKYHMIISVIGLGLAISM